MRVRTYTSRGLHFSTDRASSLLGRWRHISLLELWDRANQRRGILAGLLLTALATVGLPASLALVAGPAAASPACGQVLIAGSSWLGGHGVDVHSNGAQTGTGNDCGSVVFNLSANPPQWGDGWQCVELVERLYLTNGWITKTWPAPSGGAESMYGAAPANLVKEPQGSITHLSPGDAVVFGANFFPPFGHIGVVGTMSADGSSGQLYSENTSSTIFSLKFSGGTVTFPGIAAANKVTGVVHAPGGSLPGKAAVSVSVSSSANPSSFGQSVTLTATVAPQAANANTPGGGVQLLDGATNIGSGSLTGGTFQVTTASLSVGSHSITAKYAGDSNFLTGNSPALNQVVNKAATTTAVTSSVNPSVYGQPVTFTATVTSNSGAGDPTGTVQIFEGSTPIGSGSVSGGTVSITAPPLAVGTHAITASYGGDQNFLASTSAELDQVVNKAPTTTTLSAAPSGSAGFGHPVTFTATVGVPPPGAGTPTGALRFSVDGTPVQTVNLDAAEKATVTTSALSPGSHLVTASYQGDSNFLSSGGTLTFLVTCSVTIGGNHPSAVLATGDSTCVVNASIGGAIVVPPGTALAVIDSNVSGSITSTGAPGAVEICGNRIGGAVSLSGAQGLVIVGDPGDANCAGNTISGALVVRNNIHGVEVIGNTVMTVVATGNSGPGPYPGDSTTIRTGPQ